ncbi:MAG TPA: DUF4383 domain-containing protein [Solirubrobacteraceae bacterium]|nr:DUF4383 domain-containing protein [Solirubrobacteraceae bacterium]
MGNSSIASKVGIAFGAFYVAIGVIGFAVTGWGTHWTANTGAALLGVDVNPFHNFAHIGIGGLVLILCLQKNSAASEGALMGVGLFYIVAFVIGVTSGSNLTILSITGEGALANFFHLLSGLLLLVVGLLSSAASASQAKRRGLA